MMNRMIKLNCPFCEGVVYIKVSEDFKIVSVEADTNKLSKEEQEEFLKKHGIEFG